MGARLVRIGLPGLLILCFAATLSAAPGSLSATLDFAKRDVAIEHVDGFDVVRMADALVTANEGHPELPMVLVRFALPDGAMAASVRAVVGSRTEIDGRFTVRPHQPYVRLSQQGPVPWIDPDAQIYASSSAYPESPCSLLDSGNASGKRVATVAVFPVQYVPADKKLILNEEIEVAITLAGDNRPLRVPALRSEENERRVIERVRSIVVNPEDVPSASISRSYARDGGVDYLIITSASLESSFEPLADWKTQKGLVAEIVTTSWINSNYSGVDEQERIRNCIIDYYETEGTLWVLLGGDTSVVPARVAPVMGDAIRCDLYYSDLDGTWNADGDGTWGEITQDDLDLYADVYVGRAPVDNTTEAARFVNKVLTYEGSPDGSTLPTDYQLDMLFLAEVLWDSPWTDHAECKNGIDDDSVPERYDPITKLYQTNGLLTKSNTISKLNQGQCIINHNGHANYSVLSIGSSSLYNSDFDNLTNAPRYGVFYTIGCWAAAIDYNCIAEHWVNSSGGGGVAFVGNSRYGWGSPGFPGSGPSDIFDRWFFKKLYNEGLEHIGVTHAAHKDELVGTAAADSYMRYCLYQLNLLGEPEMLIWTDEPVASTVGHSTAIPLGEHPFVVTVSRNGEPVVGARVCLSNGEMMLSAVTGIEGVVTLLPSPTLVGTADLTVTGRGTLPYLTMIDVLDQPPDTDPPAAITTLTAADPFDTGGHVSLDWNGYSAPADFAYYKIYRQTEEFSDVSGRAPIEAGILEAEETAWDDATVVDYEIYYYAITAVDLAGNENTTVTAAGPVASTINSRVLVWDADDGDTPFDGINDDYSATDGTEVPWLEALDALGELYMYTESEPADMTPFDLVIYLGGVVELDGSGATVQMTDAEATALTDYADGGGNLYIEEPNFGRVYVLEGTPATLALWDRFHATYGMGRKLEYGNVEWVVGQTGALTENMSFDYDYQGWPDQFVNKIGPNGDPGTSLLWSDQDTLPRGSLYVDAATGSHRYMVPLLLGGTTEGPYPSTRLEYVTRVMGDVGLLGTTGIDDEVSLVGNRLAQNLPNPFNPATTIRYSVAQDGAHVSMAIYDVSGRLVARIVDGPSSAGDHAARWDGRNANGEAVSSGIYFCRLAIDGWRASRKMVLMK